MKFTQDIIDFSKGDTTLFEAFADYWNHYCSIEKVGKERDYDRTVSFAEKESALNKAIVNEIVERSGVPYVNEANIKDAFTNPSIRYETFAVVGALIDSILPQTIVDSIGLYTDVRFGGFGDSFTFDITPRDIFTVSKSGRAQKQSEVRRQFNGQVAIIPEMHQITVGTFLYRLLSGAESLADFTNKAVRSIETQMTLDAYSAFSTAMAALSNTATTGLRVAGYTQNDLIRLCQQVSAWNGGANAVIFGTKLALSQVLPGDANYRYDLSHEYVRMGYIRTAFGYDLMSIPQVADHSTEFGLKISNNYIWILSPSADKLVKLCIEGSTLTYGDGQFDNANLTQNVMMLKAWNVGVATSAIAGVITLS